ncbi:hypothetical protein APPUASWS_028700 [Arthrospira platensis str. Paraca]|nr:hypothetical protein APPUASWS_028700 [Arthrospira platensis str. Paraca]
MGKYEDPVNNAKLFTELYLAAMVEFPSIGSATGLFLSYIQTFNSKKPRLTNKSAGLFPNNTSIAPDRKVRTYNGEDEMTKKTKNASPL